MKLFFEVKLNELEETQDDLSASNISQEHKCETCCFYFDNKDYSDFNFICEDGISLPVHRVFLAKKSMVFKKLFDSMTNEQNTETLGDIESKTMNEVLRFIYCGYAVLKDDVNLITRVLYVAALYEIPDLVSQCMDYLMEQINKENVMAILEIANAYSHVELENKCLEVILK